MKVAVLLTGQPRHLEQGSWWIQNKVFPKHFRNLDVDYYAAFWDDGTEDLGQRVQTAYNPIRHHIYDYEKHFTRVWTAIHNYNINNPQVNLLPDHIKHNILCLDDHTSTFAKNFWGQFIMCGLITQITGHLGQYDIVIKTRSDTVFRPMQEQQWLDSFKNMGRNPVFHNKMLADWMYIKNGRGFIGDFAFFAKPEPWFNFSKNAIDNCISVATDNCLLWYDEHHNQNQEINFPHKMWTNLSALSKTDWLSYHVVWPTPYSSTLLRGDYDVQNETFESISDKFHEHEQS